jgi:hypothetical protein
VPSLLLEDRIRELCSKAVATEDSVELESVLSELRDALREQLDHIRRMVSERALRSMQYGQPPTNEEIF